MTTIKDIAQMANVSTATVSRVLNDPESVSPVRRQRVLDVIKKLNYTPNAMARDLVTKSTKLIGLIIPDITNTFSPYIIDTFLSVMYTNGYHILVSISNYSEEREYEIVNVMEQKRVDGLVFLGPRHLCSANNEYIAQLARSLPIIAIDYLDAPNVSHIRTDEEDGAYQATRYLIELGHRRIAFINGPLELASYSYKYKGFVRAMEEAQIPVNDQYIVTISPNYSGGYHVASELLRHYQRPTAIFVAGDQIAIGAYRAASENGLTIPLDLSIMGFSGSPISASIYPPLTTIAQYPEKLGEQAAYMMLDLLNGVKTAQDRISETRILTRSSCSPPRT